MIFKCERKYNIRKVTKVTTSDQDKMSRCQLACAPIENSDQPGSLIKVFDGRFMGSQ